MKLLVIKENVKIELSSGIPGEALAFVIASILYLSLPTCVLITGVAMACLFLARELSEVFSFSWVKDLDWLYLTLNVS